MGEQSGWGGTPGASLRRFWRVGHVPRSRVPSALPCACPFPLVLLLLLARPQSATAARLHGHAWTFVERAANDNGRGHAPVFVDIHLPVHGAAAEAAKAANDFLNARLGNAEIDLRRKHTPHVTMYLTAFSCPAAAAVAGLSCAGEIEAAIARLISTLMMHPCELTFSAPLAAGSFAMMRVVRSACLQFFSDAIVNATHSLAVPNQTAPAWVNDLPEPERSAKLKLVAEFGSPNVFGEFDPHVSLAWGPDAAAVAGAVDALPAVHASPSRADVVALGSVGAHGTVLMGGVSLMLRALYSVERVREEDVAWALLLRRIMRFSFLSLILHHQC